MSFDEYDQILDEQDKILAQPFVVPEQSATSEYDQILDLEEQDNRQQMQTSLFASKDVQPEKRARAILVANQMSLPPQLVEKNLDLFEKTSQINKIDVNDIERNYPATAKMLRDPVLAGAVLDDLDNLKKIEQQSRKLKPYNDSAYTRDLKEAFNTGWDNLGAGAYSLRVAYGMMKPEEAAKEIARLNKKVAARNATLPKYVKEYNKVMEKEGADVDEAFSKMTTGYRLARQGEILRGSSQFVKGAGLTVAETIDQIASAAARPKATFRATTESLAFSAPSLATGASFAVAGSYAGAAIGGAATAPVGGAGAIPGAAIGGTAGMVTGTFMGSTVVETGAWINAALAEHGYDITNEQDLLRAFNNPKLMAQVRNQGFRKGVTTAAIDATFSAFAGRFVVKAGKGATIARKTGAFAADVGVQATGEAASEFGGQVAAREGDLSKVSLGESVFEGIASMGQSAATTAAGAIIRGGDLAIRSRLPNKTDKALSEVAQETDNAQKSLMELNDLAGIGELVREGKSHGRNKEIIAKHIDQVTPDDVQQSVYFQADDFDDYYASRGESPIEKAEQLLATDSYDEARKTGGVVEIPLSKYVEELVDTEDYDGLLEIARTRPDAKTRTEASQHMNDLPETMNALAKEAAVEVVRMDKINIQAKQVEKLINQQLRESGQRTITGTALNNFIRVMSIRQNIEPMELYNKYGIQIRRGVRTDGGSQNIVFNQGNVTGPPLSPLGFYSEVETQVTNMNFREMPAKQLWNTIQNAQGVKKDELEVLGLEEFLTSKEGKVSKEEVINFIQKNGLQVSQITLSQDYEGRGNDGEGIITVEDLNWDEGERDKSYDEEVIHDEFEYYGSDDYWQDDTLKELEDEIREQFPDLSEEEFQEKIEEEIQVRGEKIARETVEAEDYNYAKFKYEEERTGWTLVGNEEQGYYSAEAGETFEVSINEAKVQLTAFMIEQGLIQGDIAELSKESDISWRSPSANYDYDARDKEAEEMVKLDTKWKELARQDYESENVDLNELTEENITNRAEVLAWIELEDKYEGIDNQDVILRSSIDHPIVRGGIDGNNVIGWKYKFYYNDTRLKEIEGKLESKNYEQAKAEAQQILVKEGLVDAKPTGTIDVNKPVGKTRWRQYTVKGGSNYKEYLITLPELGPEKFSNTAHFYQKNYVAHVRVTDRVNEKGEKVLFIEELQSDLHQKARDQGYIGAELSEDDKARIKELEKNISSLKKQVQPRVMKLNALDRQILSLVKEDKEKLEKQIRDEGLDGIPKTISLDDFMAVRDRGDGELTYETLFQDAEIDLRIDKDIIFDGEIEYDVIGRGVNRKDFKNIDDALAYALDQYAEAKLEKKVRRALNSFQPPTAVDSLQKEFNNIYAELTPLRQQLNHAELELADFNDRDPVPDAPFKQTEQWAALALKRIIRMAAEGGYDYVAWTPSDVHVGYWGTENVTWVKREGRTDLVIEKSQFLDGRPMFDVVVPGQRPGRGMSFTDRDMAEKHLAKFQETHWVAGSTEQKGGLADGVNIEELARQRGDLLERQGETIRTKDDLFDLIKDTLHRDRTVKSLRRMTDKIWDQMQGETTGRFEPRREGMIRFYDKTLVNNVAPKVVKKLDKDALDKNGRISVGKIETFSDSFKDVWTINLTDKLKEKALAGQPLFQDQRGQISISENRKFNITLFENADLSTVLHESGHFFLEVLGDMAELESASQQLKDDYLEILKFLGVESRAQIGRTQHEMWARATEKYFAEGNAPSSRLRKAFNTFKTWLIGIYKDLRKLNVDLTPEVRDVFDRMFATDEEIQDAKDDIHDLALFDDPIAWGMSDDQAEKYLEAQAEAELDSKERLQKKLMDVRNKKLTKEYRSRKNEVQQLVELEVNSMKIYNVVSQLRKNTLADGTPLLEGQVTVKIDRKSLVAAYGKDIIHKLPKGITTSNDGMDYGAVAGLYQFESGDAMIQELLAAPKKKDYINKIVSERMQSIFPDLLNDVELSVEADRAVHNESRSKRLRMELAHMASNNLTALKGVIKKVARRVPSNKQVRELAENIVSKQKMGAIKPNIYRQAERRFSRRSGELLVSGDIEGAFIAKEKELLNHELYRAASDAKAEFEKKRKGYKKFFESDEKLAKTRDVDLILASRAMLARFGLGRGDTEPLGHLEKMKLYDPDQYDSIMGLIENLIKEPKNYKEMSYGDWQDFDNAIQALWDLSKSNRQMEIDGKKVDIETAKADLAARLNEVNKNPKEKAGYKKAVNEHDLRARFFLGAKAMLRRVESWADSMDGGDINGVFTRYFFRPISEAAQSMRSFKKEMMEDYEELVKQVKDGAKDFTAYKAKAIDYEFKNKAEVLGMLMHTGNNSNKEKLLVGRGWGEMDEDGNLITTRFDQAINQMISDGVITKTDMDFVQGVWDLFEKHKPAAQKAHKLIYGFHFNEITADEIETPFGTYRGGYFPAKADPFIVTDAAIRADKRAAESNNSFSFPTTGRGATKNRVQQYRVPLSLNIETAPQHIDWLARFVHLEPAVTQVRRLLLNRDFRVTLDNFDPTLAKDMLVPWLDRSASQQVTIPSQSEAGKKLDSFFKVLRNVSGANVMLGNISNAAQQFTGWQVAKAKVKPHHLRNALWKYTKGPAKLAEEVIEKSEFMKNRTTTNVIEVNRRVDQILLNPSTAYKVGEYIKDNAYVVQQHTQNIVDNVVWAGAYEQAIEEGHNEKTARRAADKAVRLTQGSFDAEDISRIEVGSPFQRMFLQFYGYFSMQANLLGTEFNIIFRDLGLRKGAGRMFYLYWHVFAMTAFISTLITEASRGTIDEDDDDEYMDDLMRIFFMSQAETAGAMVPGGQVAMGTYRAFDDKIYNDKIVNSPAISTLESAVQSPASVYKAMTTGKPGQKKRAVKDTLSAISIISGVPVVPISRPVNYMIDVESGKAKPTGPIDFTRGLVTGKSPRN